MSANPASVLSGPNGPFLEELYARYLEHPEAVDPSWRKFFAELQDENELALNDIRGHLGAAQLQRRDRPRGRQRP